jgi:hypothetical protein
VEIDELTEAMRGVHHVDVVVAHVLDDRVIDLHRTTRDEMGYEKR